MVCWSRLCVNDHNDSRMRAKVPSERFVPCNWLQQPLSIPYVSGRQWSVICLTASTPASVLYCSYGERLVEYFRTKSQRETPVHPVKIDFTSERLMYKINNASDVKYNIYSSKKKKVSKKKERVDLEIKEKMKILVYKDQNGDSIKRCARTKKKMRREKRL